jgi:GDP-mannose 6-dehydrogenase
LRAEGVVVYLSSEQEERLRISVFGLGYVGTVSAACLAADGHGIVGVDVNADKIEAINAGTSPIVEPGVESLLAEGHRQGLLRATASARDAIQATDMSLVCVGTPSHLNGSLDLRYVQRVCTEIGAALRDKSSPHLVVMRSTMLPGTTETVAIPALEAASGSTFGGRWSVCYNPEFLREGSSVQDFYNPPKIVIGEPSPAVGDPVASIYERLQAPLVRTSLRAAEMVKYADNAFHALKITFANEIGNLCKRMGVDSHEVMSIFCRDTRLNLSPAYLRPGFAFGGSCLPKDLRALTYQAKLLDLDSPVINAVLPSNHSHFVVAVQRITGLNRKRIGFLGMAFKSDTDDLRESPLVEMIETLLGKGYSIRVYDKNVSVARLVGANRRFMDEHVPHLSSLLVDTPEQLVDHSEVLVIGHASPEIPAIVGKMRADQFVVDLVAGAKNLAMTPKYEGICW